MDNDAQEKRINRILNFWFGELEEGEIPEEERRRIWWIKDGENDKKIKERFEGELLQAAKGDLEEWESSASGTLALIILLDQFSRNIYRDTPGAFSQDGQAIEICMRGLEKRFDANLHPVQRVFFYMPFMHSEDMRMQERSIEYYTNLKERFTAPPQLAIMLSENLSYAQSHYAIIKRFGRYPHRNHILGRESTPEEAEFLTEPGSSF